MSMTILELGGKRVLVCPAAGRLLGTPADALDLIGEASRLVADWVAVPVERLDHAFFRLATGMAGEFIQKLVNYRLRLAVVGDISPSIAQSKAMRDFVFESNLRGPTWFVADLAELGERLTGKA